MQGAGKTSGCIGEEKVRAHKALLVRNTKYLSVAGVCGISYLVFILRAIKIFAGVKQRERGG